MLARNFALALLIFAVAACGGDKRESDIAQVFDDSDRPVDLTRQVTRIVSLAPAVTEILFNLGVGDKVVGRTRWCDAPPEAADVTSVGDGLEPNVEVILARHPDLVVFAVDKRYIAEAEPAIYACETQGIDIWMIPDFFDTSVAKISFDDFERLPVMADGKIFLYKKSITGRRSARVQMIDVDKEETKTIDLSVLEISLYEPTLTLPGGKTVLIGSQAAVSAVDGKTVYRNIDDPTGHFGAALVRFLEAAGIAVAGEVRTGATPEDAALLVEHESKPLSLVVRDLGKFSNNFVAEELVKALAAHAFGPPGTTEGGCAVLTDYLESLGAEPGSFRVVDGSGFSRENRLSPRAIVRVIREGLSSFETSYEFAASMSVSGVDGTLEDRMGHPGLSRSVRAKTGLLDGVTAISGILETLSGQEVIFSIIVNGFDCEAWRVHDLEHALLTSIAGWEPGE